MFNDCQCGESDEKAAPEDTPTPQFDSEAPAPAPAPVRAPDDPATVADIEQVVKEVRAKSALRKGAVRFAHFNTRIMNLPVSCRERLRLVELVKMMEMEDAEAEVLGARHKKLSCGVLAMTATIPILIPLGMHLGDVLVGDMCAAARARRALVG